MAGTDSYNGEVCEELRATAVEGVGFITESQPNFEEGDKRYRDAMVLASEILARAFESATGALPELESGELVAEFLRIEEELGLMNMLRGLNAADSAVTTNRNAILFFSQSGDLEVETFRDATDALRTLIELERKHPGSDVVLVRADSSEEVQLAFKNYFSDARDFIKLIEEGSHKLSGRHVIYA
jgi:putative GTP pyrophosphokinase